MKAKFTLVALLSFLILAPMVQNAYAERPERMYYSFNTGASFLNDMTIKSKQFENEKVTFRTGYLFAGSFGYRILDHVRIEAELSYRKNKIDKVDGISEGGEMYSTSGMINGFWDFLNPSSFTPYLGAGVGWSSVKAKGANVDNSSEGVAAQAIAGISYDINPTYALTFDYRFFTTKDPEFRNLQGEKGKGKYQNNSVTAGLRVSW